MKIIQRFPQVVVPSTSVTVILTREEYEKLNAMGVGLVLEIDEMRVEEAPETTNDPLVR